MLKIDDRFSEGCPEGASAFWLKGSMLYPIGETHISAVLDDPGLFGRELEELVKIFRRHNEKIGLEARARREIILDLVSEGWIRIRHYERPQNYWTIQCRDAEEQKDVISAFIGYAEKHYGLREDDEVRVNGHIMLA